MHGRLSLLLPLAAACAPSAPVPSTPEARPRPPTAESSPAAAADLGSLSSHVTPSGRWMLGSLEDSGCIDCATPRFAIVRARGELAELGELAVDLPPLAPGFPMWMVPAELGWKADGHPVVLVDGMFASRQHAEAVLTAMHRPGEVQEIRWDEANPRELVVRIRRTAEGFDEQPVRESWGSPEATPICSLEVGRAFLVSEDAIYRPADARPWIRLPCAQGPAMFRASDTDLGLIVQRAGEGVTELQHAGGVCGAQYFDRQSRDAHGARLGEPKTLTTARCFGQPDGDAWGVCPDHDLERCKDRAEELLRDGEDLRRAARLAAYACDWGSDAACVLRWTIDIERGVDPLSVVAQAVHRCRVEHPPEDRAMCDAVEKLMRAVPTERLERAAGSAAPESAQHGDAAREGCLRGLPGWCALLDASPICDRDGCG